MKRGDKKAVEIKKTKGHEFDSGKTERKKKKLFEKRIEKKRKEMNCVDKG